MSKWDSSGGRLRQSTVYRMLGGTFEINTHGRERENAGLGRENQTAMEARIKALANLWGKFWSENIRVVLLWINCALHPSQVSHWLCAPWGRLWPWARAFICLWEALPGADSWKLSSQHSSFTEGEPAQLMSKFTTVGVWCWSVSALLFFYGVVLLPCCFVFHFLNFLTLS